MAFDISHHNGDKIDFVKAKAAGNSMVYIKCSQGSGYADPLCGQNLRGAQSADMWAGLYHFYMAVVDPMVQAKFFCDRIDELNGASTICLPPCVDLEDDSMAGAQNMSSTRLSHNVRLFIDEVVRRTRRQMVFYAGVAFVDEHLDGSFGDTHLWLPHYTTDPTWPAPARGWSDSILWQYSEFGSIPGVGNGNVDLDRFRFGPDKIAAWVASTVIGGHGG